MYCKLQHYRGCGIMKLDLKREEKKISFYLQVNRISEFRTVLAYFDDWKVELIFFSDNEITFQPSNSQHSRPHFLRTSSYPATTPITTTTTIIATRFSL
jgi:hypothetical protein